MESDLPLSGINVVEFSQYIVGPAVGQLLHDQGARVTKVESPDGDNARRGGLVIGAAFETYNRGKEFVSLDLRLEDDRARALSLCDSADVVVSNLRPGVMERFGLDAPELRQRSPRVIAVTISGFGKCETLATRPGLDGAAQAESGLMWVNGENGGQPLRVGVPVVDIATSYVATQAACSALLKRVHTGKGSDIQVNLMDVAIHMQGPYWRAMSPSYEPIRCGNGLPNSAPSADVIRVKDGYVIISAYIDAHWHALCRALDALDLRDKAAFATPEARAKNRTELLQELEARVAEATRDDVCERLTGAGVVAGAVRRYPEVVDVRGLSAEGPLMHWPGSSEGVTLGVPCSWDGVAGSADGPGAVGADNQAVFG